MYSLKSVSRLLCAAGGSAVFSRVGALGGLSTRSTHPFHAASVARAGQEGNDPSVTFGQSAPANSETASRYSRQPVGGSSGPSEPIDADTAHRVGGLDMASAADVIADIAAGRQGRQTVQDVRKAFGPGDAGAADAKLPRTEAQQWPGSVTGDTASEPYMSPGDVMQGPPQGHVPPLSQEPASQPASTIPIQPTSDSSPGMAPEGGADRPDYLAGGEQGPITRRGAV